jgi:hypothetical protein
MSFTRGQNLIMRRYISSVQFMEQFRVLWEDRNRKRASFLGGIIW